MKKSILTLLMALVLVVSIAAPAGAGGFMDKMRTLKNKIVSCVEAVKICFTKSSSLVVSPAIPFPPLL